MENLNLFSPIAAKILSDKRDAERVRSTFSGSLHKDDEFLCHCIIRDVSKKGMKLEIQEKLKLPDDFVVRTPAMTMAVPVRLAWRNRKEIGVKFVPDQVLADGS